MNCLRYWTRYVRKGEVKGGGNTHYIIIMGLINQINLGSDFMRPIESINRLIQTQSKLLQYTHTHTQKKEKAS